MDSLLILGKGGLAGFIIAAPVGPVGVLCVHRTLSRGRADGLVCGLGAAIADALYGCVAAFGLSLIADWLTAHETAFRLVGGAFLLVMAIRMLRQRPAGNAENASPVDHAGGLIRGFFSTFFLTATNPITIVAFLGIFAFFGIGSRGLDQEMAMMLVLGVFVGSSVWWLSLAAMAGAFRKQLAEGGLTAVNRMSGVLLLAFGLYGIGSVLWDWIGR